MPGVYGPFEGEGGLPTPGEMRAAGERLGYLPRFELEAFVRPRVVGLEHRPGVAVPEWQLECQPRVEEVPYHGPGGTCGMASVVTSSFPMVERAVAFGGHTVPLFFGPGS